MTEDELILRMRVEGGRVVSAELDSAEHSLGRFENRAKSTHGNTVKLGGAFSQLRRAITTVTGVVGLAGIGLGIGESIKNAEAYQNTLLQLGAAIKANVRNPARDATKEMGDFAEHLATVGGFVPTESIAGMSLLLRTTHNTARTMQDLTLATNIARGSHKSLAIATRAVAMVEGGRLSMLTRLGIVLPKHATAQQAYATLMNRYAGATQAFNRSASGAMSNFIHTIDILGEKLALKLVPYLTIAFNWLRHFVEAVVAGKGEGKLLHDIIVFLWQEFLRLGAAIGAAVRLVGSIIGAFQQGKTWAIALVAALVGIATAFVVFRTIIALVEAWRSAQILLDIALEMNPIAIVITAIAGLVAALIIVYLKVKAFRDIVDAVWGWMRGAVVDTVDWVGSHWKKIGSVLASPFTALASVITSSFNWVKQAVIGVVDWIIDQYNSLPFIHGFHVGPIHVPGLPKLKHIGGGGSSTPQRSFSLPGHQGRQQGGPIAYAGQYTVGEMGPERVFLPAGAFVQPHYATAGGGAVFEGVIINNMDGREIGRGQVRVGLTARSRQE